METHSVPPKAHMAINDTAANRSSSTEVDNNSEQLSEMRAKLRPPSASLTIRPRIQSQNGKMNGATDLNGNIPRPSSLPRPLKTATPSSTSLVSIVTESNVSSKIKSLLMAKPQSPRPSTLLGRTCSLESRNRTIVNLPPVSSMKSGTSSGRPSVSPSPSSLSLSSNRSNSAADYGIAFCSTSHSPSTVPEKTKKSAQSLVKLGSFQSTRTVKPSGAVEVKKASVERINRLTPIGAIGTSTPRKMSSSMQSKFRQQPLRVPPPPVPAKPWVKCSRAEKSSTNSRTVTPQLVSIRNRAAQVLSRSRSTEYKPIPSPRPRLSVEAIVANLEQEIRHQLGPELPPLPPVPTPSVTSCTRSTDVPEPSEPEKAYIQTGDDDDFIEDIQTPSSFNSQHTPCVDLITLKFN